MALGKPYATHIRNVIGHVANANPEYRHVYFTTREVKRVAYIIVSSDRGLCGGLNINAFKTAVKDIAAWRKQDVGIEFCAIGAKAATFFNSYGGKVVASIRGMGDAPELNKVIGAVKDTQVILGGGGDMIDAVSALWDMVVADPISKEAEATTPLFRRAHGTAVTIGELRRVIKTLMERVGLDPRRFGAHSLRIGGATAALAAGL